MGFRIWILDKLDRVGTLVAIAALTFAAMQMVRSCNDDDGYGSRRQVYAAEKANSAGRVPQNATYGTRGGDALPDPDVTPGATDPRAMADPSGHPHRLDGVEWNICAADFRTGPIRAMIHNFAGLKKKACEEYSVAKCDKSVEGDHLISIEIGGCPDCLTNIWPQPMDEARVKDHQVEDVLPKLVCAGDMTLTAAQRCIAEDWVACAQRIEQMQAERGGR